MPKSKTRNKPSAALSGLPRNIVALAPSNWPDAKKAAWCRAYILGAKNPGGLYPRDLDRDYVAAYRQGQRASSNLQNEVAQVADVQAQKKARSDRYNRQRQRELGSRLERLHGGVMDDPVGRVILDAASSALGVGAAFFRR